MQRPLLGGTEEPPEGKKEKKWNGVWYGYEIRLLRSEGQGLVGEEEQREDMVSFFLHKSSLASAWRTDQMVHRIETDTSGNYCSHPGER